MKQIKNIGLLVLTVLILFSGKMFAQTSETFDKQQILDSLTTVDEGIRKYFPRWKICEPDLQIQIYQTFVLLDYDKKLLDRQSIEVLAAPRPYEDSPFELLMITCGEASMNSVEIDANIGGSLVGFLTGSFLYQGKDRLLQAIPAKRDYCYSDIPTEIPMTQSQAETIISYLQPTNVSQAFTLSLFEQSLKIGETGFWLRSIYGNDEISMPFWYAGSAKLALQRPLYVNSDSRTTNAFPYLINAYLGASYRTESGLKPGSLMSWVPKRILNNANDGKMLAGFDFHMPFKPEVGLTVHAEFPLRNIREPYNIKAGSYGYYAKEDEDGRLHNVSPVLRNSGVISAFYHWWLNPKNPENYLRFNLGLNYTEVKEWELTDIVQPDLSILYTLHPFAEDLYTYRPREFGDWLYAKVEYRSQAAFPFGFSLQYSNQSLLGDVWIPLFGNWFYLQAKYATPLRPARPYEIKNFFMISPLLRLTI
ncbi:MAG: hypothetical protein A2X64_00155 [Ignavibacteria bacterium GWF2_33_9]|nr:MAG: hypothetical protein A2X64_00155 [Ignavibacteria bacterium GWF2_33_9]